MMKTMLDQGLLNSDEMVGRPAIRSGQVIGKLAALHKSPEDEWDEVEFEISDGIMNQYMARFMDGLSIGGLPDEEA